MASMPRKSTVDQGLHTTSRVGPRPSSLNFARSSTIDPTQMMYFNKSFRAGKGGFKTPLYQNTYRLEARNEFEQEEADKILRTVMEQMLRDTNYNAKEAPAICQNIARRVQMLLFKKNYDRYKVVVSVTIVEKKDAGMFMSFEHLFDATKDRYSTFVYENPSLCGAGVISAFYYD